MPLNKLQQQAVEYLEGPLLVLAGPGTGKTQLLSSKVAYILTETDTNPENILCLTFTESGAGNMRARLQTMIGRAANKVNIHTYHSFGSTILAEYKNYNPDYTRALDANADPVTQHKIIRQIQQNLDANDIMRNGAPADILETISSAKSARLTAENLDEIADDNIKITAEMARELDGILQGLKPRMKFDDAVTEVYRPILEVFAKYIRKKAIVRNVEREANFYLLELNQIIEEASSQEKPSVKNLTAWKNKRFEKTDKGEFRLRNLIANRKLKSIAHIMAEYDKYLEENGLFDFSDMIEQAIKMMQEDRGFRLSLSERYQYILLDEFQDTNPSQAEIISLLTKADKKPNLMAVGDDDQAIFEFQGASASNFLEFQERYRAKVITLKENYRSPQEVLDFSRRIADQLDASFAKANKIDKQLVSVKSLSSAGSKGAGVSGDSRGNLATEASGAAGGSRDILATESATNYTPAVIERHEFPAATSEYAWIAEQIHLLIEGGVKQSEIAVIAPMHKCIAPILPYLKTYEEINVAYEKRDNLFEDAKIHQLLALARFAYDIAEEKRPAHRLLEILSFPFWKISPLAAIKAVNESKEKKQNALEFLTESEDADLKQLGTFLADLSLKSFDVSLELFLDYLTGTVPLNGFRSSFLEFYAKNQDEYQTFELYENLSVLREALKSHIKTETPKLKDLIEFLDDYEAAGQALINTSPYQDSENAVQVLTAHKSKGLEFDYCFLISVDNRSWGMEKGNNNFLSLPVNLMQIRHTGATDDEKLRLLFVAATRAKRKLIMSNSLEDFSGKKRARLEYLEEREEGAEVISPLIGAEVVRHFDTADLKTAIRNSWISAYQTLTPEMRTILRKRLEHYQLTASDLTSFIDIIHSGPMEFYKNKILRAPREPANNSLIFGNLIHAVFEAVTKQGISDTEALEMYKAELLKTVSLAEDQTYLLERGTLALERSLKTFKGILRNPEARAEVDLRHEHPVLMHTLGENAYAVPLTGKIDHFNLIPETRALDIYDFKTSAFHPENWASNASLYKYMLQLGFYKLLLNLSPTYAKYKVRNGHILFVYPDQASGEVHNKWYDYPEEDEQKLKDLAAAVYAHIKTLDFLDDPELFVEPDQNRNVYDLRKFIEKTIDTAPEM